MMCRITQFFSKSFLIGTVRKVYSCTHGSIYFEYWQVILKIRPLSYFHDGHPMSPQRSSNTPS